MSEENIDLSIETGKLKLNPKDKSSHFAVAWVCFLVFAITPVFIYLRFLIIGEAKSSGRGVIIFFAIASVISYLLYKLQLNKLKFKIVETNLKREELDEIINRIAKELKWIIFSVNKRSIIARTFPSILSGSWGEQITILFDKNKVLVNSICDPKKQSSIVSMGRNKRNMNRLIEEIEKAVQDGLN